MHYLTYTSIESNSEGAATGIILSWSTQFVKMLLKHFNRRQKQVIFAVIRCLRAE